MAPAFLEKRSLDLSVYLAALMNVYELHDHELLRVFLQTAAINPRSQDRVTKIFRQMKITA